MNAVKITSFKKSRWIFYNFLGWIMGIAFILILSSFLDSIHIEHFQFYLGIGMGAGIAFGQWLYLRKVISLPFRWVYLSALGLGIPFVIMDLIPPDVLKYKLPISVMVGILLMGYFQILIFKKFNIISSRWFTLNSMAWLLAIMVVFSIDYFKYLKTPLIVTTLVNFFCVLIGGVIIGLITLPFFKQTKSNNNV